MSTIDYGLKSRALSNREKYINQNSVNFKVLNDFFTVIPHCPDFLTGNPFAACPVLFRESAY
jgi:hypothetical protein